MLFLTQCVPLCQPPTPHPFLTTWWSVHCQAIWSVMLFTPPSSQKGKEKIFDKIWWLAQVVCFTGLLVLLVRAANKICVCVCVFVCLQYMIVCLPQALYCGAVMLSVTLLWPEPCSQRNQLWNWQVCLLHSPTLFPSLHTHWNTHFKPRTHNEAHSQKHTHFHSLRFKYTCTRELPPHPHISTDHHTSCRQSLSCQLKTQCKRNTLTELWWAAATPKRLFYNENH